MPRTTLMEKRLERLPNWAQAYIGKLSRQIMQLSASQGIPVPQEPDPSPVFIDVEENGVEQRYYLPLPEDGVFTVEAGRGSFKISRLENGIQLISSAHRIALAPNGRGNVDVILVPAAGGNTSG